MEDISSLTIEVYRGAEINAVLNDLAALRIRIFREYPYRYEGKMDYEQKYLQYYGADKDGLVVLLRNADGTAIGAATGLPARGNWSDDSLKVFGNDAYYWGEFILDRNYRGKGCGSRLYKAMSAEISKLGYTTIGIYMIVTSPDDPARPADYLDMSDFARNHGFTKIPGATEEWEWVPLGETVAKPHTLQAWIN